MSEWWRGAVIYQIYPRSFADTDEDGVGDLNGITQKLDYVASLGVDGIWLSPFFTSPMADYGYDVADYCGVDPLFGTMADFEALLVRAHALGLKVIIDQVYSHTSDQHDWFAESRRDATNDKADWYVWADPKADGTPPNNWLSVFGGPAWTFDARRRQYYLHNFLSEQPDLNLHNPAVQDAILDVARFWLDKGIDGFRLDVTNFYMHDRSLADNPPLEAPDRSRPYGYQRHLNNRSQADNMAFIARLRTLIDSYEGRMSVAEIFSQEPMARSIAYTQGADRLHTAYNFHLLGKGPVTARFIREAMEGWVSESAWPSWSFSNHDVPRVLTRWGGPDAPPEMARLLIALLSSLRGTSFLYQGEELGLPQAELAFEDLRDPEGIRFWPDNLGRDGCRTPIPWQADTPHAGFSPVKPWLPVDPRHEALAVSVQDNEARSTLNFARTFLAFRKEHPTLRVGAMKFLDAPEPVVLFTRLSGDETLLCAFNLSDKAVSTKIDDQWRPCLNSGLSGTLANGTITLPPYGGLVAESVP